MRLTLLLLLPLTAACATSAGDGEPAAAGPAASPGAAELIAARKAMMHMAATLLYNEVLPAAKDGGEVKGAADAADGLARFGRSMAGLFPEGSGGPDSRALPAVWDAKAEFAARARAYGDSAARLKALAEAGDTAGFAAQAKLLEDGCAACHESFRAERKRPS